ncbi:hypothetical protein [Nostoc sp. MG11]|uniref:hypothetical protein n=1 Tax=Nostoc sp. MG11 TaxID=2721166 RepID=UPI0018694249|nr:hypothetical protein [Nostoc sp. MG11]
MDRRRSPGFRQVCGHVPDQQYRTFKSVCAEQDITVAEALEEAITLWLKRQQDEQCIPLADKVSSAA